MHLPADQKYTFSYTNFHIIKHEITRQQIVALHATLISGYFNILIDRNYVIYFKINIGTITMCKLGQLVNFNWQKMRTNVLNIPQIINFVNKYRLVELHCLHTHTSKTFSQ